MTRVTVHNGRHAMAVAWKLHLLDYRTEGDALRVLKRRCPGLRDRAPKLLADAKAMLEAAITLVNDELTACRKYPQDPGGYRTSTQLVQSRAQLAERFPGFPVIARDDALEYAFIYNVL